MRSGATQSSPTAHPDIRITIGSDVYTSQDGGRLTRAFLDEQVWGGQYIVEIDNADESLNSKNYKGSGVIIYNGFIGGSGSNMSPMWVHNQQFISREGKLLLQLNCIDAWGLLQQVNADLAMAAYNQDWQQASEIDKRRLPSGEEIPTALKNAIIANYGKTIFEILEDLVGTIGITVTKDDDDGIIDTRQPPLRVSNPVSGVRQLLDMTKCYLKWKSDGTFCTYQPDAHSTVYSFNVANLIINNLIDAAVVIPNRVTFYALDSDGDDWIKGFPAVDDDSYTKLEVYVDRHYLLANFDIDGRSTTAELTALATGALAKIQGERSQGVLVAPMHCGLELFDKVEIQDGMYDPAKVVTGYIHRIIREYDRGIYRITIQLGGVTGGYTVPGGNPPVPLAGTDEQIPSVPGMPLDFAPAYLPAIINIPFSADDDDDVSWGAGWLKTADGTVYNISSGSKHLDNSNTYYVYYDVEADTGVLAWTQSFGDTVSHERILIGFVKKGENGEPALIVIGTMGADLYIDVLSAITANLGLINAGEIRLGKFEEGHENDLSYFTGWRLWLEDGVGRMAGIQYQEGVSFPDNIQWYSGSDGKLYAGGGVVRIASDGLSLLDKEIYFRELDNTLRGMIGYSSSGDEIALWTIGLGTNLRIYTATDGHVVPGTSNTKLGTLADPWHGGYFSDRLKIPVGTDMYD